MTNQHVAVIGAGLIGQSWAIAFARAGCEVRLHDVAPSVVDKAPEAIALMLDQLAAKGLLAGQEPSVILARVRKAGSLAEAVDGAVHVQENAPERLEVKRPLFAELDALAPPDAVLASSTSALLPSAFTSGLAGAHRCLVAHPLNPPHLIPAVEVVPSPETSEDALSATLVLLTTVGQRPIRLTREVPGFVMNRLQGALLDEAMALVAEGLVAPGDIDTALRDGLGRRWAFMGPFETIDLNAPGGIADFLARYDDAYAEIGRHRPGRVAWGGALAQALVAARREALPVESLQERQAWRDGRLAALAAHLASEE